jgi:hypothetical protein
MGLTNETFLRHMWRSFQEISLLVVLYFEPEIISFIDKEHSLIYCSTFLIDINTMTTPCGLTRGELAEFKWLDNGMCNAVFKNNNGELQTGCGEPYRSHPPSAQGKEHNLLLLLLLFLCLYICFNLVTTQFTNLILNPSLQHATRASMPGPTLSDGFPPFRADTRSSGPVPREEQHASCQLREPNFFVADVPQNISNMRNWTWLNYCIEVDGKLYKPYQSGRDIMHYVRTYIGSILDALNIGLYLCSGIGIKSIRSDFCALLMDDHSVGVIEIKLPGKGILRQPTVVGELYDHMLSVSRFYGTDPVIGILTTGEEWMICWFPEDDQHFGEPFQLHVRKQRQRSTHSPPGGPPSQQRGVAHNVNEEKEEDTAEEKEDGGYLMNAPDRILSCTGIIKT